jgi:hypothetical protein
VQRSRGFGTLLVLGRGLLRNGAAPIRAEQDLMGLRNREMTCDNAEPVQMVVFS